MENAMERKEQTERFKKGSANLAKIDGVGGQAVIDSLAGVGEDVGKYIIEFAFGDIYGRDALNFQQREMITITSLLSQGDTEPQLEVHINAALNVRLTQSEIVGIFIQCIPYVGFPKVLNALFVAQKVFDKQDN